MACCFPSGGGSSPDSSACYFLEGSSFPRLTRSHRFSGDFPGLTIFNGQWDSDPSTYRDSSATLTARSSLPGSKWTHRFSLQQWLPASSQRDYCLVFLPDGSLMGNDLPFFDGAYHLLVMRGGSQPGAASPPPNLQLSVQPAYFKATRAADAHTIRIDSGGGVEVLKGVEALLAGSIPANVEGALASHPLPPSVAAPGAVSPQVDSVLALSKLNPDTPSGGPDVTVGPDGFVTLQATASDLNQTGERLYCVWTITPDSSNVGSGDGVYSVPVVSGQGAAMDWDPQLNSGAGGWKSCWQWAPPPSCAAGDRYQLAVVVQDQAGQHVTAQIRKKVHVVPPGKVLVEANRGAGNWFLYSMNLDGTGVSRFHIYPGTAYRPSPLKEGWPSCSADGQRLAFTADVGGGLFQVFVTDRSGSFRQRVSDLAYHSELPAVSPRGDLVAYRRRNGTDWELVVVKASGGAPLRVRPLGPRNGYYDFPFAPQLPDDMFLDRISWHADNRTVYYTDVTTPLGTYPYDMRIHALDIVTGADSIPAFPWHMNCHRGPHYSVLDGRLYHAIDFGPGSDPYVGANGQGVSGSLGEREESPYAYFDPQLSRIKLLTVMGTPGDWQVYSQTSPNDPNVDPADRFPLTHTAEGQHLCPVYLP